MKTVRCPGNVTIDRTEVLPVTTKILIIA